MQASAFESVAGAVVDNATPSSVATHLEKHGNLSRPNSLAMPAVIASALALASCGGGDESGTPVAFSDFSKAQNKPDLLDKSEHRLAAPAGARIPDATAFLNWAENQFPQFFPGPQPNIDRPTFVFRAYPTGNFIAVASQDIYVLGVITQDNLVRIGTLDDFACFVYPESCQAGGTGITDNDAARFLLQAQFSASLEETAAVRQMGYAAWLDQAMNVPTGITGADWLRVNGYNAISRETQFYDRMDLGDYMVWNQLMTAPDAVRKRAALALSEYFVVAIQGVDNVEQWLVNFGMARYWDILSANAFGSFRRLLEEITLSAVMGVYLNTKGNQKEDASGRQPDENYAREVMQLFTIGLRQLNLDGTEKRDAAGNPIDTYTQSDVSNLARVFTGYDLDQRQNPFDQRVLVVQDQNRRISNQTPALLPMQFFPERHSTLAASFLGTTVPANTEGPQALAIALDTLANHPNVGPFFGKQMIQRLVTSNPSPAYVARVATVFNNNGSGVRGDLRAVFRAILLDEEARNPNGTTQSGFGKLREPIVRFVQWGRTFADLATRERWRAFERSSSADGLAQSPLRSPSVFNFFRPGYVPPSTALAASRSVAPEFQIVNESSVSGYLNHMMVFVSDGVYMRTTNASNPTGEFVPSDFFNVPASYSSELPLATNSAALVDRLGLLLCAGRLSASTKQLMVNALNVTAVTASSNDSQKLTQVHRAVYMVMACPEYLVQK